MIKIIAILFFVISSTCALRDLTRHIINQKVFMKRSVERKQSSLCDSIITDCSARVSQLEQQHNLTTREGLAEYLSDVAVLSCGSCFNEMKIILFVLVKTNLLNNSEKQSVFFLMANFVQKGYSMVSLMEIFAAVMTKIMLVLLHAKISAICVMFWDAVQFCL